MIFRLLFFLWLCGGVQGVVAQNIIKGQVLDSFTRQPLPGASVFISNTSWGTVTDAQGRYQLQPGAGRYELVVTFVGYEKFIHTINTGIDNEVNIFLKAKPDQLKEVVVGTYEKDGWSKWGKFFLEAFFGTTEQASACKLLNSNAVRFRHDKSEKRLLVFATEPLIIENHSLGYIIRYELETFEYNFGSRLLFFTGFPLFTPMDEGLRKERVYERRRREVYEGSVMHFMRSLYRNQLAENGFEMRKMEKHPNYEKQRVKQVYRQKILTAAPQEGDSTEYYQNVLTQPDMISKVYPGLLPGDSIAFAIEPTVAGLQFEDYLQVRYTKRSAPWTFQQQNNGNKIMLSEITMITPQREIAISANGSYYPPNNLLTNGYWAWSEKISTMLPFDYK